MRKNRKFSTFIALLSLASLVFTAFLFGSCAKEHTHEWGPYEPYIESTCYVVGQEVSTCSVCGAKQYRELPLAHEFELKEKKIEDRKKVLVCSVCGTETEEELTSADIGLPVFLFENSSDENAGGSAILFYENGETVTELPTAAIESEDAQSGDRSFDVTLSEEGDELPDEFQGVSSFTLSGKTDLEALIKGAASERIFNETVSSDSGFALHDPAFAAVYEDEEFLGIYSLSFPLDGKDGSAAAVIVSVENTPATQLRETPEDLQSSGFELSFSAGDEASATESFKEMISFVSTADGAEFSDGISEYIDVDFAIDSMLVTFASGNEGCLADGIKWITSDGKTWAPFPNSFSYSWGSSSDGGLSEPGTVAPNGGYNALWEKLDTYFGEEIASSWENLRQDALSLFNIEKELSDHIDMIPDDLLRTVSAKWQTSEALRGDILPGIVQYANSNIYLLDLYYGFQ